MDINYLTEPDPRPLAYKRIIWLGVTETPFHRKFVHDNSDITLQEEILSVGTYPVLLQWETPAGEKHYAEIKKADTRTTKTNRR